MCGRRVFKPVVAKSVFLPAYGYVSDRIPAYNSHYSLTTKTDKWNDWKHKLAMEIVHLLKKEMLALLDEQIFLTDSVFARLPMGVEIYDASGILRCLNERARLMYGVKLDAVINKVNLFKSPYVDEALLARIQSGDDIVLEFEYDFDRMNKEYFHTSNKNTIIYEVKIVPITNKQGLS